MDGAKLDRLTDEAEIRRLTARYSDAVTHLDPARAAAVYAPDGVVSILGQEITGREAIEAGMRTSFAAFSLLQLIEHGGIVEADGDRATARWSTVELTVRRESEALNVIFGRYEDRLSRTPEGWRFTRRSFSMAGRAQLATTRLQLDPSFYAGFVTGAA